MGTRSVPIGDRDSERPPIWESGGGPRRRRRGRRWGGLSGRRTLAATGSGGYRDGECGGPLWRRGGREGLVHWEGGADWAPEPEISFMCRLGFSFKLSESLGTPVDERKL